MLFLVLYIGGIMAFDRDFVDEMGVYLRKRLTSKTAILKAGGEQALAHSTDDLTRIRYALQRIEGGRYGLCAHCGSSIAEERLRSIPETPFCTDCARSIEAH